MKLFYVIGVLLSVLLLSGCEKGIGTSESDQGAPEVGITAEAKQGALTVAEAQRATQGSQICVKGFIVAATTRSMTNAEFSAPFTGNTALVLASKKSDGTAEQFTNDELFPVSLSDASKGIKDAYNLASNPQYHNQYVYIYGTRDTYRSVPSLNKVKAIEIDPNHVVTSDEEPDATDDSEQGKEGDQGNSDDPEEPDTPEPTVNNILTVADAINAPEGKSVMVKGYIVGAVSSSKDNISFNYPTFDGNKTAIALADQPYDPGSNFTAKYYIVYLSDSSNSIKKALNLVEHPENHNKLIQISGIVGFYYGTKLIIEVKDYDWLTP